MFKQLFSFFSTSKKRRRGSRRLGTRKLETRKLRKLRSMRGGWGGPIIPVVKKTGLMKGGWGEPIIVK